MHTHGIEAVYLALRWPVVGGFMGWSIWGKRWIGLLRESVDSAPARLILLRPYVVRGGIIAFPQMLQPFSVCWGRARV